MPEQWLFLLQRESCANRNPCAGDIQLTVPLMISVLSARWSANLFNEGLYDIHVELNHLPYLPYHPPPQTSTLRVRELCLYCACWLHVGTCARYVTFRISKNTTTCVTLRVMQASFAMFVFDVFVSFTCKDKYGQY